MKYRTTDNQTVDEIAWKHYGYIRGAVEQILEANAGLADHGAILPSGLVIHLPEIQKPFSQEEIRLWG